MEPLNDENKLKLTKRTKIQKHKKSFKTNNTINCNKIHQKLIALSNIIHLIFK